MDSDRFDGLAMVVGRGVTRRRMVRGVLGSALAGVGLVRVHADTAAIDGRRCCRRQRRRYNVAKRDCEAQGRTFPQAFSCKARECDPRVEIAYLCLPS